MLSKLHLPRPLELYSVDDLKTIAPAGSNRWRNRFEDPSEPAKSWTWEAFSEVYQRPGFHFMVARVAQRGAMFRDAKLPILRSLLASRWNTKVDFTTMAPRHDWMLCTVESIDGAAKEILTTALIRLHDGNASYVVRHFGPPALVRDLTISIVGSSHGPRGIYDILRKQILTLEAAGIQLNWRVAGVRNGNFPGVYRASFILNHANVYWPWTHRWGHPYGVVPASTSLLSFEPVWNARKPYACQFCYSSDHSNDECPLLKMKIGGVPLVSAANRAWSQARRPLERMMVWDNSLEPVAPREEPTPFSRPAAPQPVPTPTPAKPIPPTPREPPGAQNSIPTAPSAPPAFAPPAPPPAP
jgi:hypothetical protein